MYKCGKQRGGGLVNVVTLGRSALCGITGTGLARTLAAGVMGSRVQDRTGEPNSCKPQRDGPLFHMSLAALHTPFGSSAQPQAHFFFFLFSPPSLVMKFRHQRGQKYVHVVGNNAPSVGSAPAFSSICFRSSLPLSSLCHTAVGTHTGATEKRLSCVNTWLSLRVHSHLIIGREGPNSWKVLRSPKGRGRGIALHVLFPK